MKKLLIYAVTALAILSLTGCVDDTPSEPEKNLSVTLSQTSVTLPYGEAAAVEYTLSDANGKVTVSVNGLPDKIAFTNTLSGTDAGSLGFTSSLDEDKEIDVKVVFEDQKTTVKKDLKLLTTKNNPFTITVDDPVVSVVYDERTSVEYTAIGAKGDVRASFKEPVEGFTLNNVFDKASGKGKLTFETTVSTASETKATVVFSDTKSEVEVGLTLKTGTWVVVPSEPVIDLQSEIIYPAGCGQDLSIPFTIDCGSDIDEVTVFTGTGITAQLELASDKKSGTIRVAATPELGALANIALKAKNSAGESEKSFSLAKAFVNVDKESFNVGSKGTTTQYSLIVSTNLDVTVTLNDSYGFVDATTSDNLVVFTVKENASYTPRTANFSIKEPLGKLDRTVLVSQAGIEGDNASDRAALIALYDALNMKEWTDYGCFGTYYKNWCTDEPMDKWLGVALTGYNGEGRVWYIHLTGEQPNSTGYIPEELGHLTKLKEFQLYPGHKITHLPESIKNLLNLRELCLADCEMDMDLSSWTGLTELMNNPNHKLADFNFQDSKLHGTIPEWLCSLPDNGGFWIAGCHFSGQVPDKVANAAWWSREDGAHVEDLEACPRFDKTKYKLTEDGWYYRLPHGEALMYLQADNYALWVGERPSNTKWVDDKFGGHWEWTED